MSHAHPISQFAPVSPSANGAEGFDSISEALAAEADERSAELDATCRVPRDLYDAAAGAQLFRQLVPRPLSGLERRPIEWFRTGVVLARHEASFAWVVTQGAAELAWIGAGADPAWADEFFGDAQATSASTSAGRGRLTPSANGYRISGRWAFNSGCQNASWIGGLAVIDRGVDDENPEIRWGWVPAERARVMEDWDPTGLRGTGSHGVAIAEQEIPARWTFSPFAPTDNDVGAYRCAVGNGNWLIATSVAATQLGNARRALDEARTIVETKTPTLGIALTQNAAAQRTLTETEGRWQAGIAGVEHELERMWSEAVHDGQLSVDQRIRLHRANVVASQLAVQIVDAAREMCGSAATHRHHVLDRCHRDAQALRVHVAVSGSALEQNAMLSLGLLRPHAAILV